jgi:hypothetical protein
MGDKVYAIFEGLGFGCLLSMSRNRPPIFEDEQKSVRYFCRNLRMWLFMSSGGLRMVVLSAKNIRLIFPGRV